MACRTLSVSFEKRVVKILPIVLFLLCEGPRLDQDAMSANNSVLNTNTADTGRLAPRWSVLRLAIARCVGCN